VGGRDCESEGAPRSRLADLRAARLFFLSVRATARHPNSVLTSNVDIRPEPAYAPRPMTWLGARAPEARVCVRVCGEGGEAKKVSVRRPRVWACLGAPSGSPHAAHARPFTPPPSPRTQQGVELGGRARRGGQQGGDGGGSAEHRF
jgi:hypothetical protein